MKEKRYDIIGDIHGHADELKSLLKNLGYEKASGVFQHPQGRQVIFLGDYIDRGPKIREALQIVRGMVDAGQALAILGNHEVNAIRFQTQDESGEYLRPHTPKNVVQHQATLDQFPEAPEWAQWLDWLAGLPLALDLGDLRAVHASWDDYAIAGLRARGRQEGESLILRSREGTLAHEHLSRLLNGPEALLPEGHEHQTSDGRIRNDIRVKWWLNLEGLTCAEAIFPEDSNIPALPPRNVPMTGYADDAPPTFFGHYALKDAAPAPIRPNLACLDYGTGKGGFLCAYRWDGEQELIADKFVVSGDGQKPGPTK